MDRDAHDRAIPPPSPPQVLEASFTQSDALSTLAGAMLSQPMVGLLGRLHARGGVEGDAPLTLDVGRLGSRVWSRNGGKGGEGVLRASDCPAFIVYARRIIPGTAGCA